MKRRTLASVGAVLLYVYCEVCQASPSAFLEDGGTTVALPTARTIAKETEDVPREHLTRLFGPAKVAR